MDSNTLEVVSSCSSCLKLQTENESLKALLKKEHAKRKLLLEAYEKLVDAYGEAMALSKYGFLIFLYAFIFSAESNVSLCSNSISSDESNARASTIPNSLNRKENYRIRPPSLPAKDYQMSKNFSVFSAEKVLNSHRLPAKEGSKERLSWYFVDIDGDAKLQSWPAPSVG